MRRLSLLLAALVLTGCSQPGTTQPEQREPTPAPQREIASETVSRWVPPVRPTHLRLWKFDAPVVRVPLVAGGLTPPSDPSVLGWWGRPAGARHGTTLLTGHTVHTGGGELDDLEQTPVGSVATVSGRRYRVTRVAVISKQRLAAAAPRLFSQSGPPRLIVVTCEDYDAATGHYRSNVVVVATPEKPI